MKSVKVLLSLKCYLGRSHYWGESNEDIELFSFPCLFHFNVKTYLAMPIQYVSAQQTNNLFLGLSHIFFQKYILSIKVSKIGFSCLAVCLERC